MQEHLLPKNSQSIFSEDELHVFLRSFSWSTLS